MESSAHAHTDEAGNRDKADANHVNLSTDITQPVQIQLNSTPSRKSSTDSSQRTHVDSTAIYDKDYNSQSYSNLTIPRDTTNQHNILDEEEAYYFPNKPYRFQKKWLLVAMTSLSFATIGINESAIGALIPQMEKYYNKSEAIMSFSFLASSGGYLISTFISSYLIHHLPLRYVLMIASFTYSGGSLIGTFRPPFGAMMASFIFTGFGGGLLDTAATSVIVHFEDGPLLTITYSFFSLGSMASPFLVGGLQKGSEQSWEVYFWFPFALAGLLFILQWFVYRSYKAPIEKDALHFSASRKLYLIIIDWTIIAGVLLTFSMFAMQDSWSQWSSKYLQDTKELGGGIPQIGQGTFWAGVVISRILLSKLVSKVGETRSSIGLCTLFAVIVVGMWVVQKQNLAGAICLNILLGFVDGPLVPVVLSTSVTSLPHYLKQPATSAIICGGLLGSSIVPLVLGQAVNAFSTDIVPGVLIVCVALNILLFVVQYTTKYHKLVRERAERLSISGWIRCGINKDINRGPRDKDQPHQPHQQHKESP